LPHPEQSSVGQNVRCHQFPIHGRHLLLILRVIAPKAPQSTKKNTLSKMRIDEYYAKFQ
jgi:hypothetical protein